MGPPRSYLGAATAEVHQRRRGFVNLAAVKNAAAGQHHRHPLPHGSYGPGESGSTTPRLSRGLDEPRRSSRSPPALTAPPLP